MPTAFMSLSARPNSRAAASFNDEALAPLSSVASIGLSLILTMPRTSGSRAGLSLSRTSAISETGVLPAQYAMLALPQSSLGKTKRMAPLARSYSVSAIDRMSRPMMPMLPAPGSMPPTMNCTSGRLAPSSSSLSMVVA